MEPKFPVWVYMPPGDGSFPFFGAVKLSNGTVKIEPFPTKKQAIAWTEKIVAELMVPGGEKR